MLLKFRRHFCPFMSKSKSSFVEEKRRRLTVLLYLIRLGPSSHTHTQSQKSVQMKLIWVWNYIFATQFRTGHRASSRKLDDKWMLWVGMAQDTRQLTNSVCLRLETCFPTLILSNFMNPRQSSLSDLDLVSKFDFFSSALAPHTHTRARTLSCFYCFGGCRGCRVHTPRVWVSARAERRRK